MTDQQEAGWRNLYGRRRGKSLRDAQSRYLTEDLPRLALPGVRTTDNPARTPLDLAALFSGKPVWLEIGIGAGEHLAALSESEPEIGLIGVEHYLNGMAIAVGKLRGASASRVRLHHGDARDLIDVIPDGALQRVYLLYPDPWPKKKHHRRRFITPEFMDPLLARMAQGAELRIATDIEDYVRHTLAELCHRPELEWLAECPADWREPWAGWHRTRYEEKAIREGRVPHYLRFRRT